MKKITAFLLCLTMIFSLCACSLGNKAPEVPSKRDAQKAAEEEYDMDLDFVSEDISRHEDEAEWVFVNEEVYENGGSTTTTVLVTWNSNHPDRFRFSDEVEYVEPLTIIEETEVTVATEVTVETTVAETTVPTETTANQFGPSYIPGYIEGDSFISEEFGFEIALPDGWSFATEQQLSQLGYNVADLMASEDWAQSLANGTVAIEFYMFSPTTENINLTIGSLLGNYTPESFAISASENLEAQMASLINILDISVETYEINGVTYYGTEWEGTLVTTGDTIYERQLYFVSDDMVGTITVASPVDRADLDVIFDILNAI